MDCIKNRRTIRKYKQDDVPASLLNELLEEAFRASTMGNMQLYSVVVTRNAEMKSKLAPAHFNQPMVTQAPVVLTFCADFNRFSKWCRCRQAEPGYDNPISFMNAATDALLVTQNFCTLAEEKGLGICYLGTTIYNPDQIISVLQLPELVMPVATITVGYPDEMPEQPDRLPLEGLLHEETYRDYTTYFLPCQENFFGKTYEPCKFILCGPVLLHCRLSSRIYRCVRASTRQSPPARQECWCSRHGSAPLWNDKCRWAVWPPR